VISLLALAAVVGVLFAIGKFPRIEQAQELKKMHSETVGAVPIVHIVIAHPAQSSESLLLPGNIGAILYTTIYARVDGYLKSRLVDIGDHVKKGQLLAVIDTPTVDEKLKQGIADWDEAKATLVSTEAQLKEAIAKEVHAQAEVERTKANLEYAAITAKRYIDLASRGAVSLQNRDEKVRFLKTQTADVQASEANDKAAQAQVAAARSQVVVAQAGVVAKLAAVQRLRFEQGFQKVLAPFDGVITLRKVDPGALITQGSQTNSLELFQMAKIDRLRIYVSVPQRVARYLKVGMGADIIVSEYPDGKFRGEVTNVSGALDPNTRTRQTEIQIANPDRALLPGMYAEVRLTGLREAPWIRVPGTTIVTRPQGQFVVIVENAKAHYQPVVIGRDYGDEIEIRTGLKGNEQVVVSPSDDLIEGEIVQAQAISHNPI